MEKRAVHHLINLRGEIYRLVTDFTPSGTTLMHESRRELVPIKVEIMPATWDGVVEMGIEIDVLGLRIGFPGIEQLRS